MHARPGVMELIDEARAAGLKLAVCSAATKSSVTFCIENLLGRQRYEVCRVLAKSGSAPACSQAGSCCLCDTALLSMTRLAVWLHVSRLPPLQHVLLLLLAPARTLIGSLAAEHRC